MGTIALDVDKKVILIIVEGISDKNALKRLFEDVYGDEYTIQFKVIGCDITVQWPKHEDNDPTPPNFSNERNIGLKLALVVREALEEYGHAKQGGLSPKDIHKIIHIIDTDGAFVDNCHIVEDRSLPEHIFIYSTTDIKAQKRHAPITRNKYKSATVRAMIKIDEISSIPYSVYFMSCNLDHVLYDEMNLPKDGTEKNRKARIIRKKFTGNPQGYLDYLKEVSFLSSYSYRESWIYIQKGLHSLNRHTNLGIQFSSFTGSDENAVHE